MLELTAHLLISKHSCLLGSHSKLDFYFSVQKPLTSESDSEQDLPQISVTGNRPLVTATDKPPVVSISGNPPLVSVTRNPLPVSIDLTGGEECIEKSDKEDLEATRRLIREQDELFEESHQIDREKVCMHRLVEKRHYDTISLLLH